MPDLAGVRGLRPRPVAADVLPVGQRLLARWAAAAPPSTRCSRRWPRATRSRLSTCRRCSTRSRRAVPARRSAVPPASASSSSCRSRCRCPTRCASPTRPTRPARPTRCASSRCSTTTSPCALSGWATSSIGGITVNVPDGRAVFQGDFDLRNSLGFVLRVSAGIDPSSRTATWLLQAIDPETGEVLQDATRGLLLPNNAQGRGTGFVSWTAQAASAPPTAPRSCASARVQLDNQAPFETDTVSSTLDSGAPTTTLTVTPLVAGRRRLARAVAGRRRRRAGRASATPPSTCAPTAGSGRSGSGRRPRPRPSTRARPATPTSSWRCRSTTPATASCRRATTSRATAPSSTWAASRTSGRTPQDVRRAAAAEQRDVDQRALRRGGGQPARLRSRPAVAVPDRHRAVQRRGVRHRHRPELRRHRPAGPARAAGRQLRRQRRRQPRRALRVRPGRRPRARRRRRSSTPRSSTSSGTAAGGLWATSGGGQLLQLDPTTLQIIGRYGDGLTQALAFDAGEGRLLRLLGRTASRPSTPPPARSGTSATCASTTWRSRPTGRCGPRTWPRRGDVRQLRQPRTRPGAGAARRGARLARVRHARARALEGLLFVSARIPSGSTRRGQPLPGRPRHAAHRSRSPGAARAPSSCWRPTTAGCSWRTAPRST